MGWQKRLLKAYSNAPLLSICKDTPLVLFSDCHRGIGNSNDNFLKNQHLYFAALSYYYRKGHTYIELGDGDELWENRHLKDIQEIHGNVFWLLEQFHCNHRLYMLYGNHDMVKRTPSPLLSYPCFESLMLQDTSTHHCFLLVHGHQADTLNSAFWRLSRFMVRYFWQPLEEFGVLDPTSAAKNYSVKGTTETRLEQWGKEHEITIIAGHTHRSVLDREHPYFINTGSCVHPRCITCIEIVHNSISLVKWSMEHRNDLSLYVARTLLSGPFPLQDFTESQPEI